MLLITNLRTQKILFTCVVYTKMPCFDFDRAIKREEEKSLENSLNEAIADSSSDTPVSPKPGMNNYYSHFNILLTDTNQTIDLKKHAVNAFHFCHNLSVIITF